MRILIVGNDRDRFHDDGGLSTTQSCLDEVIDGKGRQGL